MKTEIKKLGDYINKSKKILLINHIRMDGDAFGSLGSFFLILQKLGKNVKAVNDYEVPKSLQFLSKEKIIETNFEIKDFNPDIIISLDASDFGQLGEIYEKNKEFFEEKPLIVIDHHLTNPGFGNINIIDIETSSTCELVYEIYKNLGYDKLIDNKIANFILTGIYTDTNIFYNKNTSSKTIQIASELFSLGAESHQIIFELFRKKSLKKIKLFTKVLSHIEDFKDGKIVGAIAKKEDFGDTDEEEISGLLNECIATIEGAKIAFLIYETEKGNIKGSLRSNDDTIDVAKICALFGGGGHKLAAGFKKSGNIDDVKEELLKELEKVV
ncbi:bifunctional oligoribonuclease/PAP phosphatase NrnA [Candidatus Gracilibacteria bacterium]|nr:bifunctional oligoribonuclease/PAP phosphatase NrnA [Candidatus Gracilibacteria bacterium]NUJ99134.1 bifunctional oligoribonuclease/PAP phosphatase NrnA [Candidatus Gracilibacteria bacterium]